MCKPLPWVPLPKLGGILWYPDSRNVICEAIKIHHQPYEKNISNPVSDCIKVIPFWRSHMTDIGHKQRVSSITLIRFKSYLQIFYPRLLVISQIFLQLKPHVYCCPDINTNEARHVSSIMWYPESRHVICVTIKIRHKSYLVNIKILIVPKWSQSGVKMCSRYDMWKAHDQSVSNTDFIMYRSYLEISGQKHLRILGYFTQFYDWQFWRFFF